MLDNEPRTDGEGGLGRWLESIGLSEYAALFASHRIDLDGLPGLISRADGARPDDSPRHPRGLPR